MQDAEKMIELLNRLEPALLAVIPAVFAVCMKIKNKIAKETKSAKSASGENAKEQYRKWEREETRRTLAKIRELCNVYKNRSGADSVLYMRVREGTCVTCAAENTLMGRLPRRQGELQCVPMTAAVSAWVKAVCRARLVIPDVAIAQNFGFGEILLCPALKGAASHISAPVRNQNGRALGIVVFNYASPHFNGSDNKFASAEKKFVTDEFIEQQTNAIEGFRTAVETVFLTYLVARADKLKEIGLK